MALRKAYGEQLTKLRDELTQMGNMCTLAVQLAVDAVKTGNEEIADQTRATDEVIEKEEQELESLCMTLLLRQQPVAGDLRRISAAQKMISDLERIGDQAADIAEISSYVVIREGSHADDLYTMAEEVIHMVRTGVKAFIDNDQELAQGVIDEDDKADDFFVTIKNELITAITTDPAHGGDYLEILMLAKYLERIADHAVNVAEWVKNSI